MAEEMMDTSGDPGELAPLPPEVKINMKLDDIIKHEKKMAAVSHNLQFSSGRRNFKNQGNRRRNYPYRRPFFYKRRFRSQNWRLGYNGPNVPNQVNRRRQQWAFLNRMRQNAPRNSVFHRLGWTPAQQAASYKVGQAKGYRPYNQQFQFQKRLMGQSKPDPDRFRKLLASRKHYSGCHGISQEDLESYNSNQQVQPLSAINLQKLSQALGGNITSYKQEQSDAGTVITTITKASNSSVLGSHAFLNPNQMAQQQSFNCGMSSASTISGKSVFSHMAANNALGYAQLYGVYGVNGMSSMNGINGTNGQLFNNYGMNYEARMLNQMAQQNGVCQQSMSNQSLNPINGFRVPAAPTNQQNGFHSDNSIYSKTTNGSNFITFEEPVSNANSSNHSRLQMAPCALNAELQNEIRNFQSRHADTPPPLTCSQNARNGALPPVSFENRAGVLINSTKVSMSERFAQLQPKDEDSIDP